MDIEKWKPKIVSFLQGKGLDVERPFNCLSPDHDDSNPSMSFDKVRNRVKCFSCGVSYDLFDLLAIEYGVSNGEAIHQVEELLKKTPKPGEQTKPKGGSGKRTRTAPTWDRRQNDQYIQTCHSRIDQTRYFEARGISFETLKKFPSIGYDPAFKVHGQNGEPVEWKAVVFGGLNGYTVRNTDPQAEKGERYRNVGTVELFNAAALWKDRPVVITEGAIDALSVEEVGGTAVSLGSVSNIPMLIRRLKEDPPTAPLVIMLDRDDIGKQGTEILTKGLTELGIQHQDFPLPDTAQDINDLLMTNRKELESRVQTLADQQHQEENEYRDAYQVDRRFPGFFDRIVLGKNDTAIPTGFPKLDEALDGGLYNEVHVLGAVTSLGKTTFSLQVADNIAKHGKDVLILSLEMGEDDLMARSLSRLTFEVDSGKAKTMRGITRGSRYQYYTEPEMETIREAIRRYEEYAPHLFIREGHGDLGIREVQEMIDRHQRCTGHVPVVIVDYLQILYPYDPRLTDKQNVDKSMTELKRLARGHRTPIIVISSFNRQNYDTSLGLAAFKESGAIEYSTDVALGIELSGLNGKKTGSGKDNKDQVDRYELLKADPRKVKIKILKSRNGIIGTEIPMEYYARYNCFFEAEGSSE